MRPPLPVSFLVCRLALPAEAHFQAPLLCLGFGPPLLVSPVSAAPSDTPDSHAMPLTSREACHLPLHHDRRTGSRPGLVSQHRTALGYSFPAGQARWWGGGGSQTQGPSRPRGQLTKLPDFHLEREIPNSPPCQRPLISTWISPGAPALGLPERREGKSLASQWERPPRKMHANPFAPEEEISLAASGRNRTEFQGFVTEDAPCSGVKDTGFNSRLT